MTFLLVLRAYSKELSAFWKSKKIVLAWFLCPDTCRLLQGIWVEVVIFLSMFILYSKLWFSVPMSWRIFEERWCLWRTVVLQSSNSAALHTSVFSILAPYIPALYPKTHLVQPLRYRYGCFLSHGIIYPSYATLVSRKGKRKEDYSLVRVLLKGKTALLTLWCYAVCCHPVVLKFQSSTQQKICNQKIIWVKKEVICLVDR